MSEYLDNLGTTATVGDVFYDLYGKADASVAALNALRTADGQQGTSRVSVPDTELYFFWSSSQEMRGWDYGQGWHHRVGIQTRVRDNRVNLFSRSTFRQKPDADDFPSDIGGARGQELDGDYSMHLRKDGLIEVRLGKMGLWQTAERQTDEPIGKNTYVPDKKVKKLGTLETQQLVVVTDGIIDNLIAAEMIRDGAAPSEVIDAMGKPMREPAY